MRKFLGGPRGKHSTPTKPPGIVEIGLVIPHLMVRLVYPISNEHGSTLSLIRSTIFQPNSMDLPFLDHVDSPQSMFWACFRASLGSHIGPKVDIGDIRQVWRFKPVCVPGKQWTADQVADRVIGQYGGLMPCSWLQALPGAWLACPTPVLLLPKPPPPFPCHSPSKWTLVLECHWLMVRWDITKPFS